MKKRMAFEYRRFRALAGSMSLAICAAGVAACSIGLAGPAVGTAEAQVPWLESGYRLQLQGDPLTDAAFSCRRDWFCQTRSVLAAARTEVPGDGTVALATDAFDDDFAEWRKISVPSAPDDAALPAGLHRPNFHRLYKQIEFLEPDDLAEEIGSGDLQADGAAHGMLALQVPLLGGGTSLLAPEWPLAPGPRVADYRATPEAHCPTRDGSSFAGWERRHNSGERSILLVECARVYGGEGGGPFARVAPQLLVYDAVGRLALVAGFGQVSRYEWSSSSGSHELVGGRTLNGFGIPGARVVAVEKTRR